MPDSTSFGVGGKMRQTSARRMSYPNKSASVNRLGRNDPHPAAIDDKDLSGVLRGGLRELCNHVAYEDFVALLQLRELPTQTLDLAPLTERQFFAVKV